MTRSRAVERTDESVPRMMSNRDSSASSSVQNCRYFLNCHSMSVVEGRGGEDKRLNLWIGIEHEVSPQVRRQN